MNIKVSYDHMIEQLEEGYNGVFDTLVEYMDLTNVTDASREGAKALIEAINNRPDHDKIMIQLNCACYSIDSSEDVRPVFRWISDNIGRPGFEDKWVNALDRLKAKLEIKDLKTMDRIGIINIITFVTDYLINDKER